MFRSRRSPLLILASVAWLACVLAGFGALAAYSQKAGDLGAPPRAEPSAEGWRLVMAILPRCPDTCASLVELQRLLAWADGQLACDVYVDKPPQAEDGWDDTERVRTAHATPGVKNRPVFGCPIVVEGD